MLIKIVKKIYDKDLKYLIIKKIKSIIISFS